MPWSVLGCAYVRMDLGRSNGPQPLERGSVWRAEHEQTLLKCMLRCERAPIYVEACHMARGRLHLYIGIYCNLLASLTLHALLHA